MILTHIALWFQIHIRAYCVAPIVVLLQVDPVFPYESKIVVESSLKKKKVFIFCFNQQTRSLQNF